MKINVCDNPIAGVCVMHWAMLLRVISDRQRHLRWYCLHFSHWRGRRLSWGVGRRDLTQQAGENLILCPRWIKTSKYIIHGVKRPSGIVFFMRRLLRDVSFPFQNEQVHSADPHFAKSNAVAFSSVLRLFKCIFHQICNQAMCRGSSGAVIISLQSLFGTVTADDSTANINRTKSIVFILRYCYIRTHISIASMWKYQRRFGNVYYVQPFKAGCRSEWWTLFFNSLISGS